MQRKVGNDDSDKMVQNGFHQSFPFVFSQAAVNKEIMQIIADAETALIFISMMSQFSDYQLVQAINDCASRGVNVMLYHSVNPYVSAPTPEEISSLFHASVSFSVIPMHGPRVPNIISVLGANYVYKFHKNVTHSRFIANDSFCLFGGVDFNRVCETNTYVQHAIKISLEPSSLNDNWDGIGNKQLKDVVFELKKRGNLEKFSFPQPFLSWHQIMSSSPPTPLSSSSSSLSSPSTSLSLTLSAAFSNVLIIGTSLIDASAFDAIICMIEQAKDQIFIENQYIEHREVLHAIAKRQFECPHMKVILVGNYDFDINPYHPGAKNVFSRWCGVACGFSWLANYVLRQNTMKAIRFLVEQGCLFEFRMYKGRYTHNKIIIIDKGRFVAVGTFNLNTRSLDAGNDCEIGVVIMNSTTDTKMLAETQANYSMYINNVMDQTELVNPHHKY